MLPSMTTRVITRTIHSPVGCLAVGVTDAPSLCLIEFQSPKRLSKARAILERAVGPVRCESESPCPAATALINDVERQLAEYFAQQRTTFSVPIHTPGTDFQQAVWNHLRTIKHGTTTTYGAIAQALGRSGAQRAVGAANGANRISIVIPCHRVIDASGNLHGYGGGLEHKRKLLDLEQATLFSARP